MAMRTVFSTPIARDVYEDFPGSGTFLHYEGNQGEHGKRCRTEAREEYRRFSELEQSLTIFSRAWWLDAAAGTDDWDAALIRRGDAVDAAMPYVQRRRLGLTLLGQPALTQHLGPWLCKSQPQSKPAARAAHERGLMQALIDRLPAFDHFAQNWHAVRTDWLPFYWNGFAQTMRYSYLLAGLDSPESAWRGLQHGARNECRKAARRFGLQVRDDLPLDVFLTLNRQTFARRGLTVPYADSLVRRLDAACRLRECRKIFIAVDAAGLPHAGVYIVWDAHSTYALMSGSDTALRASGAASLCFWAAIRHAVRTTGRFDFGGSMMKPVERFFRSFGAQQVPYFCISKTPSLLLRMRSGLLKELRAI
jgi:hypothetical protein